MANQKQLNAYQISDQFKAYLQKSGLDQSSMSPIQYQETKRAFYGAWGQCMVLMGSDEFLSLHEDDAVDVLEAMTVECGQYWAKEVLNHNSANGQ